MSKKIISIFLVMVMLLGLATPAMAAEYDIANDSVEHNIATGALSIAEDGDYIVTGETNDYSITVAKNVTATITLRDASIVRNDGSGVSGGNDSDMNGAGTAAIAIDEGADVTLILEGSNTLQGGKGRAAIEVMGNKQHVDGETVERTLATLTIKGDGTLAAQGGNSAAGIGGSFCMNAGIINIVSGNITATAGGGSSGDSGAGIGGGHAGDKVNKAYGSFAQINISGGTVVADGVRLGAGLGAGAHGNCTDSVINITGGNVTAKGGTFGSDPGDGIGLAHGGKSKTPPQVNISGGIVNASSINSKNSSQSTGKTAITGGIVSSDKGNIYTVYSDMTLDENVSMKTLAFGESGYTIIVPADVTLTISEAVTGTGTIKLEGGTFEGEDKLADTVTLDKGPYKLEIEVDDASATYGDTITFTVNAKHKNDKAYTEAPGAVTFTANGEAVGEMDFDNGVVVKEYTVDIPAGNYLIKASATFDGIVYTDSVAITVAKAEQTVVLAAPAAATDGVTFNSVTLNAVDADPNGKGDVQYAYVQKPAEGEPNEPANWQTGTVFTGLKPVKTYIFYVRHAGNDCYEPSVKSVGTEITTTALSPLPTPVLPKEGHEIAYNKIILAEVEKNLSADTQYSMSKDGGETWGGWSSSKVFSGLEGETVYKFKARYAIDEYEHYSEDSNIISLTTPETPKITVSLRVVGANMPSTSPEFDWDEETMKYYDAEYQNWMKTTEYEIPVTKSVRDLIEDGLDEADIEYDFSGSSNIYNWKVTAPDGFGGHELGNQTVGQYSGWMITIKRDGEYLENWSYYASMNTLEDGDTVIFNYVFDYDNETYSAEWDEASKQNYLKIADDDPADIYAAAAVTKLINAIGEVTAQSGDAIKAARQAYSVLNDTAKTYVSAETLTVLEEAERIFKENSEYVGEKIRLEAPAVTASAIGLYNVTLNASGNDDINTADYNVVYSVSIDGTTWGDWMDDAIIKNLLPAETYYVRAKAVSKLWGKYIDSGISTVTAITTAGGDAPVIEVANKEELATALASAKTDGTLTKVVLTNVIAINDIRQENYTVNIPEGANVLLTGKDLYFNEGGKGSAIGVSANTVVTVRDMTLSSLNTYYVPGVCEGYPTSGNTPGNAWHNALRFLSDSAVINLDNVDMYNDLTSKGVVGNDGSSGTLNIYSGAYRGLGYNVFQTTGDVNLIPTGNILIEGKASTGNVNLMPVFGVPVSGTVLEKEGGSYAVMDDEQLMNTVHSYGHGLRINTESTAVVPPTSLAAPVVLSADDVNAESADVVYTVADNSIQFTVINRYGKNDSALIQFQCKDLMGGYWRSFSDVVDGNATGLNSTFTYTGLKKDTGYAFQIRYASLDSSYTDATTDVTITTTFTPEVLTVPVLGDQAEKDAYSITLTAPAASGEDSTATFEYRKSVDGVTWGEWQESPAFDNLEPGTKYYFQARYKAVHKYWLDSSESNTIELSTITATLTAPELSTEGAVITANTIELATVTTSAQDNGAIVKYFLSTDGQVWNDGQERPIFTGLNDNTKYYFKAQYISSNNNKYLDSADSNVIEITTELSADAPTFVVSEVVGRAGKTVDVTVEMKNNPGIVSAAFDVSYDRDKLELTGVSDGRLLPNFFKSQTFEDYPYYVNWEDSTAGVNNIQNGILVTFTFKVKDTCKAGDTAEIIISYDEGNIYDVNETNVKFHIVNGSVTVDDHNWSEITYTWSEDHMTCTASRTCTDDNCSEVETETVTASVDRTPSSCTVEGKDVYTAAFVNGAFETQTYTENFGTIPHNYVTVSGADNAALVKKCSCTHTEEVTVDETTPVIVIEDTHSNNKNEIKVAVSVKNNPGFKAMSFTLDFDSSKLQFVSAENKTTLINLVSDGNVITLGSAGESADHTENGDIVILTFKALTDCEGQPIALTYNITDITNADGEEVLFAIDNGKVTAANYTVGDVNGDGKVELKDVTYLRRHLATWDGYTDIVKFAGDVDGDGTVGQLDVTYLLRHVAEYEGYETLGRN